VFNWLKKLFSKPESGGICTDQGRTEAAGETLPDLWQADLL